jgi:hypothetical protein
MDTEEKFSNPTKQSTDENLIVPLEKMTSVALARLIDEVRNGDGPISSGYDRSYHRHNR